MRVKVLATGEKSRLTMTLDVALAMLDQLTELEHFSQEHPAETAAPDAPGTLAHIARTSHAHTPPTRTNINIFYLFIFIHILFVL